MDRTGDKVKVTVRDAAGERVEEFDRIILCTPLELFMGYGDATPEECELFSKIQHKEYFTMPCARPRTRAPTSPTTTSPT